MLWKNDMVIGNVVSELRFGGLSIGYSTLKWKRRHFSGFMVNPKGWINPHMVIVGESGGGKSNACKSIVDRLCKSGAAVAILDPHDEYIGISGSISAKVYDAAKSGINILERDSMSEKEKASEVTGMLRRNFRLGDVQSYMLYRCIMYTYSVVEQRGSVPTMHDLAYSIRVFRRNARTASERNVLESLDRRLSLIDTGAFASSTAISQVASQNSIFLLSGLHTSEAQAIYMEGFLRKVYTHMLSSDSKGRMLYVIIDEAQKLGDNPVVGRIAAEGRKYGVGLIAISQRAKPVDKDLRANAAMLISFAVKEPEELNYVANFIAGGNEMGRFMQTKKALRSLAVGHAVVASGGNPVIVRFRRYCGESVDPEFAAVRAAAGGIRKEALVEALGGMGVADGAGTIEGLIGSGALGACDVVAGRYSGTWCISGNRNSPEHDVCVGIISSHLGSVGIRNRIYNSSYGPDIIAFHRGMRIAVEYETGSKGAEATARMIAARGQRFAGTAVFVNDAHYAEYAQRINNVARVSDLENVDVVHIAGQAK